MSDHTTNQLAHDLGVTGLPADEQQRVLEDFVRIVQDRLADVLAGQLTDTELAQVDALAESDETELIAYLQDRFPDYNEQLARIVAETKEELHGQAARLTGYLKLHAAEDLNQ